MPIGNPFDNDREYLVLCAPLRRVATYVTSRLGVANGAAAVTIGNDTYLLVNELNPALHRHEAAHAEQFKRLGWWRFWPLYIYYHVRYGYKNNPLEIEARIAEEGPSATELP
jgi:hypothetical protein